MLSRKNIIRILINTLIGILLIFFWLKVTNLNEIEEGLKRINPIYLTPFLLTFVASSYLRAWRLKILLSGSISPRKIETKDLLFLNFLSQLLSFTIPIRAGEIAKGVYISKEYGLEFGKSLIWIFLDRFFDFWLVLIISLLLLQVVPTNLPPKLNQWLVISTLLFSAGFLITVFAPQFIKRVVELLKHLLVINVLKKYFTRISHFIIDTASLLRLDIKNSGSLVSLTILALLSDGVGWYILFSVVSQNPDFLRIFLGSLLSSLTYLIPAAPGYVGSAEASGVAVFGYGLGYNLNMAAVISLVMHGLNLICILGFGLLGLYMLKFDLGDVWKKLKRN